MDNIPRTNHTPTATSWGLTWPLTWGTSHGLAWGDYSFYLPLLGSIVPSYAAGSSTPTFTRATASATTDFEGLIKACASGESRFYGLRRVRNWFVATENLNGSGWTTQANVTKTQISGAEWEIDLTAASVGQGIYVSVSGLPTGTFRTSVYLKWVSGGDGSITVGCPNGKFTPYNLTLDTSNWIRGASATLAYVTGTGSPGIFIQKKSGGALVLRIKQPQCEDVTGQSNPNPSEYVSVGVLAAPLHGCGTADGIKYFTTENGNTVASNVVTEATGSAIATATMLGYLAEGARTNRCLQNRTWQNATSGVSYPWTGSTAGGSELVTNGTFPADTSGWSTVGDGSIASVAGQLVVTRGATQYTAAQQSVTVVAGRRYKISVYHLNGTATGTFTVGSSVGSYFDLVNVSLNDAGGATYTYYVTATTTTLVISCYNNQVAGSTTIFDDVSVIQADMSVSTNANSVAAPDGTMTANTLTATQANSTIIQDMGTVSSAAKAWGVWMKRKTGTGNVELTMDNGTAWTDIKSQINSSTWTLVQMSQTLADEDVGIRIVTSGDEVYVWNGQVETPTTGAAVISSPIGPVTTTSVTRNSDSLTYAQSGNISLTVGTLYAEVAALYTSVSAYAIGGNGTSGMYFGTDAPGPYLTTTVGLWDGTNATVKSGLTSNLNTTYKYAVSYTGTTALITGQGASAQAGTFDGSLSSGSLIVGSTAAGSIGYTVRNATIYPTADNAAALQARTT